ncbi:cyclic nucleotide-binding domain-containing protein [Ectothiorhodospiraceae bacterium BW-2]|nr:cyclic nucleotide-binding domain-containing protein [Ectothiorhodospiraceae bacterium BW-2]
MQGQHSVFTVEQMEQVLDGCQFQSKIAAILERLPMFNRYSGEDTMALASFMVLYRVPKGKVVMLEGEYDDFMCVPVTGSLDVLKIDKGQKLVHLTTIKPGRLFGEMSLLDSMPHSGTVRTLEECELLVMHKTHYEQLGKRYPKTALRFTQSIAVLMSQRLRRVSSKLIDML